MNYIECANESKLYCKMEGDDNVICIRSPETVNMDGGVIIQIFGNGNRVEFGRNVVINKKIEINIWGNNITTDVGGYFYRRNVDFNC